MIYLYMFILILFSKLRQLKSIGEQRNYLIQDFI